MLFKSHPASKPPSFSHCWLVGHRWDSCFPVGIISLTLDNSGCSHATVLRHRHSQHWALSWKNAIHPKTKNLLIQQDPLYKRQKNCSYLSVCVCVSEEKRKCLLTPKGNVGIISLKCIMKFKVWGCLRFSFSNQLGVTDNPTCRYTLTQVRQKRKRVCSHEVTSSHIYSFSTQE